MTWHDLFGHLLALEPPKCYSVINVIERLVLHELKGRDRGRWVGTPKGWKQNGCV